MDRIHDTRETFRATVDATSRPGTVESVPTAPADHAVLATLVDHEVTLSSGDGNLVRSLEREGRLTTAPFEQAAVVHVQGSTGGRVRTARRGTRKEPARGATVVYRVEDLSSGAEGTTDEPTTRVRVTGPGVPGSRTFGVAGLPATEFDAIREAQSDYPRGVDVILTADDRVAALPRSVDLEVV
jgi:alpha-D-ribose 1-methylphosphonate 5-triphosphate synthase subunit PhnH